MDIKQLKQLILEQPQEIQEEQLQRTMQQLEEALKQKTLNARSLLYTLLKEPERLQHNQPILPLLLKYLKPNEQEALIRYLFHTPLPELTLNLLLPLLPTEKMKRIGKEVDFQTLLQRQCPFAVLQYVLEHYPEKAHEKDKEGQSMLHYLARSAYPPEEQLRIAQLILNKGVAVDVADRQQRTPLMVAVQNRNVALAKFLLEQGASPEKQDKQKRSVLHYLVHQNAKDETFTALLDLLLERVDNLSIEDGYGLTPLHYAVMQDNKTLVERLLQSGADPNAGKEPPLHFCRSVAMATLLQRYGAKIATERTTPLHRAVKQQYGTEMIQYWIDFGVNVNAKDTKGNTPLHLVQDKASAQLLIRHGAKTDVLNKAGESPLLVAMEKERSEELLLFLLEHEKDIQRIYTVDHTDPRHYALLEEDPMAYDTGYDQFELKTTLLCTALRKNLSSVAEKLLEKGARVNVQEKLYRVEYQWGNEYIYTERYPAEYAKALGVSNNEEYVLSTYRTVNEEWQRTPLHWAAIHGNEKLVKMLLERGAQVNVKDYYFYSLTAYCPYGEGYEYDDEPPDAQLYYLYESLDNDVKAMYDLFTFEDFRDAVEYKTLKRVEYKRTPLHYAADAHHESVYNLLLRYGADPSVKDQSGKTAEELLKKPKNSNEIPF